ncbi:MAG: PQQ-binding-like beta-propeller repeat protein, partial [Pseudomonadota bacterium]
YPDVLTMGRRSFVRWLALPVITCLSAPNVIALPNYLAEARAYGARDCSFCHMNASGGGGHNDLGAWLVDQQEIRGAETINLQWLAERDDLSITKPGTTRTDVQPQPTKSMASNPSGLNAPARPFDYSTTHGEWPAYSGDLGARKYAPHSLIDEASLPNLRQAWTWEDRHHKALPFERGKTPDPFKATPLMVGGRLFVRTNYSMVEALDAGTGKVLWTFDPGTSKSPRPAMFGYATRGLAYHKTSGKGGKGKGRVILLASDGWLIALDAETGQPDSEFGDNGRVDLTVGLRRPLERRRNNWSHPPAICGDTIVVGNQTSDVSERNRNKPWNQNLPLGDVRGFDPKTGEQKWVFKTVPQEGELGNDTWQEESWRWMGNTNVWSTFSCDAEAGLVYLPVTAPTQHFYGGHRPGDNLFGNSIVALKAEDGSYVWHFQTVRHDIWDYDLPAPPVIIDIKRDGKVTPALAQVTKFGYLYVLNRLTGQPLWPVEYRTAPRKALPGEYPALKQPHPTWPPPFEMQGVADSDLINLTPELRNMARERIKGMTTGPLFTPTTENGTIINPGVGGGANWGGAAWDPGANFLYVASARMPMSLMPRGTRNPDLPWAVRFRGMTIENLPIVKPPWGSITAYDLTSGDIVWQVPNGEGPKDHPRLQHLTLPDLGSSQSPGLLITKSLMFHGHRGSQSTLQARRKADGKLLWKQPIAGRHHTAAPITYLLGESQYVVISSGGATEPSRLTAFRLDSPAS